MLGSLGLMLAAPLVLVGLFLAAPGLAILEELDRPQLRYRLLLGAAVGALLAFFVIGTLPDSDAAPGAPNPFNWRGATLAACFAAPFGLWSGLVWWTFFAGRDALKRLLSSDRLMEPHPNDW